jgi:hypothetical protein
LGKQRTCWSSRRSLIRSTFWKCHWDFELHFRCCITMRVSKLNRICERVIHAKVNYLTSWIFSSSLSHSRSIPLWRIELFTGHPESLSILK